MIASARIYYFKLIPLKNSLFTFMLLWLISIGAQAQITFKGTLLDAENRAPLVAASILEKETNNGTFTDENGGFELVLSTDKAVVIVEYIGYKPQEFEVTENASLEILMLPNENLLDEIVITALGVKRALQEVGFSVQVIENSNLSEVQSSNFIQNFAGKVAGLTITQGATGPGSSSKIVIRGESSFTNNNPLFVVNGTPINNNSILNFTNEAAAGFQEVDFGNGAMDIHPNDVKTISVLKGPSAAALYGARASNGVVLIETKSGVNRENEIGIQFSSSLSIETPFALPKFQNLYGQGNSGAFEFVDGLGGGINDNITYSWGPRLDQGILIPQFDSPVTLPDGTTVRGGDVAVHGGAPIMPTPFVSYADNLRDFYQTGSTVNNHLAFSKSFDQGAFRLSFSDFRNTSIIPGSNLNRNAVNTSLQFFPTERLSVQSNLYYINSRSDNRPAGGYGSENVNYSLVAWGPRSLNTAALEDYWQPGLEGIQQYAFNYTFFDNPYFILLENRNGFDRNRIFGNVSIKYELGKFWSIQARTGLDLMDEDRTFLRNFSSNRFQNGAYAEHDVFYREQNSDLLLRFFTRTSNISWDIRAGVNRLDQWASSRQNQTTALAQPGIFSFTNAAAPIESFSFDSQKRINSIYGVAQLGIKDWLYLELTGRNDCSSALATPTSSDGTGFFYPSVSMSGLISELIDLPKGLSTLQLRASWAQVGNDTDPYQTTGVFQAQTPFNAQPTFSAQDLIANGDLLPERSNAYELGGQLRFWQDKLWLNVTYYNNLTENQIISLPVAISSGYSRQVVNGGAVRSRGLEVQLEVSPFKKRLFQWDSYFNFSRNVTTVEDLPDDLQGRLTLAYGRVYDNVNQTVWLQVEEGGQVGDLYGTGYLRNENGDFVIGADGRFIVDNTLKKLGNYNPDFILGWQNSFRWKDRWAFSFLIDWRQGGILVSRTQALAGVGGQLIETEDRPDTGIIAEGVVNVGTEESPIWQANTTAIPAETYYRQFYDRNHEENNTFDASYIKLREAALSYNIPFRRLDSGQMTLTLFGRNLFAISEIPHFDPEQLAVQGTTFLNGVEDMSYATSRSIGLKLNLQF